MTWPTPPGKRIMYDQDGTRAMISVSSGTDHTPYQMDPVAVAALNSDLGHGVVADSSWWGFSTSDADYYSKNYVALIFPSPMDIQGVAVAAQSYFEYTGFFFDTHVIYSPLKVVVQTSTDTTNGLDGTWTDVATKNATDDHLPMTDNFLNPSYIQAPEVVCVTPDGADSVYGADKGSNGFYGTAWNLGDTTDMFRNDGLSGRGFASLSGITNVKGVRFFFPERPPGSAVYPYALQNVVMLFHLYGQLGSAASASRLRIRNASDSGDADLIWGDVDQNVPETRTFKVKNTSSTETAGKVTVFLEPTYSVPGADADDLALSLDGVTWSSRVDVGDIAHGSLSPLIYIRVSPTTATVGLRSAIVGAHAGRWS